MRLDIRLRLCGHDKGGIGAKFPQDLPRIKRVINDALDELARREDGWLRVHNDGYYGTVEANRNEIRREEAAGCVWLVRSNKL